LVEQKIFKEKRENEQFFRELPQTRSKKGKSSSTHKNIAQGRKAGEEEKGHFRVGKKRKGKKTEFLPKT